MLRIGTVGDVNRLSSVVGTSTAADKSNFQRSIGLDLFKTVSTNLLIRKTLEKFTTARTQTFNFGLDVLHRLNPFGCNGRLLRRVLR